MWGSPVQDAAADGTAQPVGTPTFTRAEHRRRWTALQVVLRSKGLDCAVLAYSRNVLYYAGMAVHGHVVVPTDGDPVLLVQIDSARARALSPLTRVVDSRGLSTLASVLQDLGADRGAIGVEHDFLTVAAQRRLAARLPVAELVDVGSDLRELRSVKSREEIAVLEHAAGISDAQFRYLREGLRPGVTEIEVHAELGRLQRTAGADGMSAKQGANDRFIDHAWVVSGPNTEQISGYWLTMTGRGPSPARPYGPSSRRLEPGDIVCCDIGTSWQGYHVDHARSYVLGPADDRQKRCWEALLEMQARAVEAAEPGRSARDVYHAALRVAQSHGLEANFMTAALYDRPYVGHGVGLEIDEGPLLTPGNESVLREGMVLAVEPKIIVPGWGGMTVEDTIVVSPGGGRRLTGGSTDLELTT